MDLRDTDTSIAYQNKDIVSKFFGQQMKGKFPLSVWPEKRFEGGGCLFWKTAA